MKNPKPNAALVWKQIEDCVVPRLGLSLIDRVVYSHLLRHSRLEGKRRLRFSIRWLARGLRLTQNPVRDSVRWLATRGVLRVVERSKAGHVVEMLLPDEIRAVAGARIALPSAPATLPRRRFKIERVNIDEADFLRTRALRNSIHARENGRCFYCQRRITPRIRCLDHVRPRAHMGLNSYRNLVSCCFDCNSWKGEMLAKDFLHWLHRKQRLTRAELTRRLRALQALAAGKLRPTVA